MPVDPLQLLRKLEPPVRPPHAPAARGTGATPLEHRSFDDLLSLVSRGGVQSDRPVAVAGDVSLTAELDSGQLDRLAAAADLAEASGVRRAVMLLDGRGLIVDVADRRVSDELTPGRDRPVTDIDAAVYVAGDDDIEAATPPVPLAPGLVPPVLAAARSTTSSTDQAASPASADVAGPPRSEPNRAA